MVVVEPTAARCVGASLEAGELVSLRADAETSMAGMNCGRPSSVAWEDLRRGVDLVLAVSDEDAERGLRALIAEGVEAGPCGGSGPGALIAVADREDGSAELARLGVDADSSVLFFATEGVRGRRGIDAQTER